GREEVSKGREEVSKGREEVSKGRGEVSKGRGEVSRGRDGVVVVSVVYFLKKPGSAESDSLLIDEDRWILPMTSGLLRGSVLS
ncbi:unnamed protein product, partial [Darwinula stevensoni]